jgi:hypothetical protein
MPRAHWLTMAQICAIENTGIPAVSTKPKLPKLVESTVSGSLTETLWSHSVGVDPRPSKVVGTT